jgi:class 3 adenylate cyclase
MDVGTWLRDLDLGQYETTFKENEIGSDMLPNLTSEDLKDLGVSCVGHRRKILSAIAHFSATAVAPVAPTLSPDSKRAFGSAGCERRQLTLMFCDLVESTPLSTQLDPEDMADLIGVFRDAVSAAVARFDGTIAKWMGDGALVYFGYPHAHEDDAERAARAALALHDALRDLRRKGSSLKARAGIATGLVVAGELIGEGAARERGVVGDTPNLAARLQSHAEPGSIVVAEATRRLLGRAFVLKPLGPLTVKGFDEPIQAWSLVGEAAHINRFEASRTESLTEFVGREQEVSFLTDRWRGAVEGEGRVVLLCGEAGIGKSRMIVELRNRIGEERSIVIRYQCSPYHINDAFYPIVGQIWHAARLVSDEPATTRLDKLEALVRFSGLDNKEDIAPYIASLLSVPTGGRYESLEMSPAELKERTVAALMSLFVGLARQGPVLALLEDVHWIDPSSRDVFGRLVERLQDLPVLLVVTYRPESAPPWIGRALVTSLSLNRFGRRQTVSMVNQITGGKSLPVEVLEEILVKTDGVPLFVEELTKTVLESGLLREEGNSYAFAKELTPFAIPATLQDSLMARLDRLSPVKEIAQISATIGREFSYRLLEAISPIKGALLEKALDELVESELIYVRGVPPEATYVFKHALVQDTAYASLLRSRRQRFHADIARALVEQFSDKAESAPAIIARHYTEAGLYEPAVRYWLVAAERALSKSAPTEADRHVAAGLALMPHLAQGADRQSLELSLHLAHANALQPLKGYSTSETLAALMAAKQILDAGIGSDLQRIFVWHSLCVANHVAARINAALEMARQMVEMTDQEGDPTFRLVSYRALGSVQYFAGQHSQALKTLRMAEGCRDLAKLEMPNHRFGIDPGLAILCYKLLVMMELGLLDQAKQVAKQLKAELKNHGHPPTIATCTFFGVVLPDLLSAKFEDCEQHSADLVAYCTEKKVAQFRLFGTLALMCARSMQKPTPENIAAFRDAVRTQHATGAHLGDSFFLANLTAALLAAGEVSEAALTLHDAFEFVKHSGERCWLAELYRLRGLVKLVQAEPDIKGAEAAFLKAIETARRQGARLHELRAATELAKLGRRNATSRDRRMLLGPILDGIEGGEETREVREASALLLDSV